jgi:uncharacterized membrane protein HdeD (DUF308 family)
MVSERGRRIAAPALAVLAALLLLLALTGGYASRALLNSGQFADRAAAALDEQAVSDEIGRLGADEIVGVDADLIAVQPLLEQALGGVVRSGAFNEAFRAAAADVHRALFDGDADTVTFTIADIGATARGALQALDPKLAEKIPATSDASLLSSDPPDLVVAGTELRELPWTLLALTVVALAGALWLAPDRRRTVIALGISITIGGVVATVALSAVRAVVLTGVDEGSSRDAVAAIWGAFFGDLRTALLLFAACGAVVTAAASSLLRPVDIGAPLVRAWQAIATVPEARGLRALRGALLIAAGVLIVIEHELALDLVAILAGLYLAYAGAAELMRRRSSAEVRSWRPEACSSASVAPARIRRRSKPRAATAPRLSATAHSTVSRSPSPTMRCRRPAIPAGCSPSRRRGSRTSSTTASGAS